MPVSRETVADLFRQIQAIGRSIKTVAGREPYEGLRLGSAIMLGRIEAAGEIRSSMLADQLGLDSSVISRQLGLLEGLGLTARRPDPADGRAWLSHVTPEGRARLADLRRQRLDAVASALAGWAEEDALNLVRQLTRLETDLMRAGSPGPPAHNRAVDDDGDHHMASSTNSSANTYRKVMS